MLFRSRGGISEKDIGNHRSRLKQLTVEYEMKIVFNVDETALF